MSEAEIMAGVVSIFREVFDDDELVLTPEMTADDVEDWDSVSHIQILLAVEEHFDLHLRTGDVTGLKNVGDLVDLISRRLAES